MKRNKNLANPLYKADKSDWIKVGLEVLSHKGRSNLEMERLAKMLGATKGSFYWHFRSKRDYELRLYAAFEKSVIDRLEILPETQDLNPISILTAGFLQIPYFEIRLELAIRDWARQDSTIFRKCCELDQKRLKWLVGLLSKAQIDQAEEKASQIFALTVGYGLIPEFLGQSQKHHYATAVEALLSR